MKIYVFGNPFIDEDNMAYLVAKKLDIPGIEFVYCRSPEVLIESGKDLVIMDVVANTDKVVMIDDIDLLHQFSLLSLHDFDLAYFLNLLKKMGKIKTVKIIGVPQKGKVEEIVKEVAPLLSSFNSS